MMKRLSMQKMFRFTSTVKRSYFASSRSTTVVLLRHGQSLWNKIPTFTGWCDVPLTDVGMRQAEGAARLMKEKGFVFGSVYSSELKRAYETAEVILKVMNERIEPTKLWELNERQYVWSCYESLSYCLYFDSFILLILFCTKS